MTTTTEYEAGQRVLVQVEGITGPHGAIVIEGHPGTHDACDDDNVACGGPWYVVELLGEESAGHLARTIGRFGQGPRDFVCVHAMQPVENLHDDCICRVCRGAPRDAEGRIIDLRELTVAGPTPWSFMCELALAYVNSADTPSVDDFLGGLVAMGRGAFNLMNRGSATHHPQENPE